MTLKVTDANKVLLFILSYNTGAVSIDYSSDLIRPAVNRFLTDGIDEYIDAVHRHTDSSDIFFLPRLKYYLETQFNLNCDLI